MKNIAIFASGSGTNAENIIRYFRNHPEINVNLVMSNKTEAYALERARKLGVSSLSFDRSQFYHTDFVIKVLWEYRISMIVLAGFLWLVPDRMLKQFPNQIINLHPALLPKFGGKGMYGMFVHSAVVASGEKETGITIHYVNERYDEGEILFQARCEVLSSDTPETVANKIHALEYEHYPRVIEKMLMQS